VLDVVALPAAPVPEHPQLRVQPFEQVGFDPAQRQVAQHRSQAQPDVHLVPVLGRRFDVEHF
jgi:hypothetical protein